MAIKFDRKTLVTAVEEVTPGTDPGSGYQAIIVNEGTTINPEANTVQRDVFRDSFSPVGQVVTSKRWTMTMPVELKGGGLDGSSAIVLPELDLFLRACALKREDALVITVDAITGTFENGEIIQDTTTSDPIGTLVDFVSTGAATGILYLRDVTLANAPVDNDNLTGATSGATADTDGAPPEGFIYRPTSERSEMTSLTIPFYKDGIRHLALSVRGNLELNMGVDSFGLATFNMQSLWQLPTDTANPAASFSQVQPSVVKSAGLNIGSWDLTGAGATSLQINLNNDVTVRPDMNAADGVAGIEISGRNPTGSVDPEVVELSTFDPWTKWRDGTKERLYAEIGSAAGERVRLLIPQSQYSNIEYNARDGIMAYNLPFLASGDNEAVAGTGGDDEVYLLFY